MTVCQNYFNMKIQKYKPGNQIIIFHDPYLSANTFFLKIVQNEVISLNVDYLKAIYTKFHECTCMPKTST